MQRTQQGKGKTVLIDCLENKQYNFHYDIQKHQLSETVSKL